MKLQNISNNNALITLFLRNEDGSQTIKEIKDFLPYYYQPSQTQDAISYDGKPLQKILCVKPSQIKEQRSMNSYEADLLYTKRYIIDKIPTIEKSNTRIVYFDIEIDCKDLPKPKENKEAKDPISCITIYDNYDKKYTTFFLEDYPSEYEMLEDFCGTIKNIAPDILTAWNVEFDYYYLYYRIPDFASKISSNTQTRWKDNIDYPASISIIDLLGLYYKMTLGKKESYALDEVAQDELGYESFGEIDFTNLIDAKRKNELDVKKLVELDEQLHIFEYFDEVRILSKCLWEDLPAERKLYIWQSNNSKVIDMLALAEAKKLNVVLPSKQQDIERENIEGAFREVEKTGLYKDLVLADISGAYPQSILDFCLSPENFIDEPNENTLTIPVISREIGELKATYHVKQNPNAIVPSLVRRLLALKNELKSQLENTPKDAPNYDLLEAKYDARKALCNCFHPDTNILTKSGIKNVKDLEIGDKIYNVNPKTSRIEEDRILAIQQFDYNDKLYKYTSGQYNVTVTKEHRFLVQNLKNKTNYFQTAEQLEQTKCRNSRFIPILKPLIKQNPKYFSLLKIIQKYNGKIYIYYPKNKKILKNYLNYNHEKKSIILQNHKKFYQRRWKLAINVTEEELLYLQKEGWLIYGQITKQTKQTPVFLPYNKFASFLGWFMSEGSLYKSNKKIYKNTTRGVYYKIDISQSKNINLYNYQNITKLINNLGFKIHYHEKGVSFCSEILYLYLQDNCYETNKLNCHFKKIPEYLFDCSIKNKLYFLKTLYLGDGDKHRDRYTTVSKYLKEDIIRLWITLGYHKITCSFDGSYRIYKHKRNLKTQIGKRYFSTLNYKGKVYCCTTKNGTVFAGTDNGYCLTGQSAFGVLGNPYFRLYDSRVAESITFLIRDLLQYTKQKLKEKSYNPVYFDTDSCMLQAPESIIDDLNMWAYQWSLDKFNNSNCNIQFDFKGIFSEIFIVALCRYIGRLQTKKGMKVEIKGIEMKRRDTSIYTKKFQEDLLNLILDCKLKEEIFNWIQTEIDNFKKQPILNIAIPCKLSKSVEDYKGKPIWVRALENTNAIMTDFNKTVGDKFYYIYVTDKEEVFAISKFNEEVIARNYKIDYNRMLERNILNKLENIYIGMEWEKEYVELCRNYNIFFTPKRLEDIFLRFENKLDLIEQFKKQRKKKVTDIPELIETVEVPKKRGRPKKLDTKA